jgi:hypothetical protein
MPYCRDVTAKAPPGTHSKKHYRAVGLYSADARPPVAV